MEHTHRSFGKGAGPATHDWLGIGQPQESGGKPVASNPPDLRKRHGAAIAVRT